MGIGAVANIMSFAICCGRKCKHPHPSRKPREIRMKRRDVLLAALGLIIAWQIAAIAVNRPILPSPGEVFVVFFKELGNGLLIHFGVSLWRVGYCLPSFICSTRFRKWCLFL